MEKLYETMRSINPLKGITKVDYDYLEQHVKPILDSVARLTYKCIFVFDYYKCNLWYISENPVFLCGYAPEQVKDMGSKFFELHMSPEDFNIMKECRLAAMQKFMEIPKEQRIYVACDYSLRLQYSGLKMTANYKFVPLRMAQNGSIWLSLCVVSLCHYKNTGNLAMFVNDKNFYYRYILNSHKWVKTPFITLNNTEKNILSQCIQGLTSKEIAEKLGVTNDNIKYHKKDLFNKLGVTSIQQALSIVSNFKIM